MDDQLIIIPIDISEAVGKALPGIMADNDIVMVSQRSLGDLLEAVGPRYLPDVPGETWRAIALAAVAENLAFVRAKLPPRDAAEAE